MREREGGGGKPSLFTVQLKGKYIKHVPYEKQECCGFPHSISEHGRELLHHSLHKPMPT